MNRRAASAVTVIIAMLATIVTVVAGSSPVQAAHPGGNGRIAYIDHDGAGGFDIFSAEPDGSDVLQVTELRPGVGNPEWSPDGERIVFDIGADSPGGCTSGDLWVVNADGSGLAQITHSADVREFDASWSPDGSQLVYTQHRYFDSSCNGNDMDVWVIDADGTNAVQVTDEPLWQDQEPAWSPLGDRIAFVSNRENAGNSLDEIYTAAPDGSDVVMVTGDDIDGNRNPSWSPDGHHIAYEQQSFLTATVEIWVMDADGSNDHSVTRDTEYDVHPAWSPDGTKITFMGIPPGGGNWIYTVNVDGSDRQAVVTSGLAAMPTWQPIVTPPPDDDVVIDDCDDPALATLTTVTGDLIAAGLDGCDEISLPGLTAVGGNIEATGNDGTVLVDLGSVETVGGSIDVTANAGVVVINMGSVETVGGSIDVTGNGRAQDVDFSSLEEVGGDLTIVDNPDATVVVGPATTVDGDATIESRGTEPIDLGEDDVSGDLTLVASHPEASGTTAGGTTDVSMAGPTATMHVTLPDGTYETGVPFSIAGIGVDDLGAQPGTGADGSDATIDLVEGYTFRFDVPQLGVPASLTFEIELAGLDQPTRNALLAALAAGSATLATRGDGRSSYQAFALCAGGESPTVDGCVLLETLDELGQPTTGEPALVRFSSVVGHFSSWAVAIVEPDQTDTTPPVIDTPDDVVAEATGPGGATVTYPSPVGTDDVDGAVAVQCSPTSGSTFPLGPTTVECSASDAAGNDSTTGFEVVVADTTAPAISVPAPITTTATSPSGAAVTFSATTSDAVDGAGIATCTPSSGSTFAIGATTVTCTATDATGNVGAPTTFVVTVQPQTSLPAAPVVSVVAGWGAATVTWQPPSSGASPITGYVVTATARGRTVARVNVGSSVTSYTLGRLANGVAHTFAVTARYDAGSGPAGTAVATPTVPRRYQAIDVQVACPSFVAHNPNPYPVQVWWSTTRGQAGETAIPAGATKSLAPARRATKIVVVAGLAQVQDAATGTC